MIVPSVASSKRDSFSLTEEWVVLRELGRGGLAVVVEVHRIGDEAGPHYACKIMDLDDMFTLLGLDYEGLRARVAWLVKMLDAPYVVEAIDFRTSETQLFVFFTLYRGGDLYNRVVESPEGRFTAEKARRVTRNLLGAVHYVHGLGIIHRDIKPENIWFRYPASSSSEGEEDDFVLGDFHCAIIDARDDEMYIGHAGSPGYIAPEAISGLPYNKKVDAFSLGVCVYEMLTGRTPLLSEEPADLLKEVIERDIPFPRRYWDPIDPVAKDFVQRSTKRDPLLRWSVDELLRHPWMTGEEIVPIDDPSLSTDSTSSAHQRRLSERGSVEAFGSGPVISVCTSSGSHVSLSRLAVEFEDQVLLRPRRSTGISSNGFIRIDSVASSGSSDSVPAVATADVP